jgi:hypothetical protein
MIVAHTGVLWDERLTQDLASGGSASLRELGRRLKVAPRTLKRHARRLNLWRPEWADSTRLQLRRWERVEKLRLQYREVWIATQKVHPEASRTKLSRLALNASRFLAKHDRAWLSIHSPAPLRAKVIQCRFKVSVR